MAENNICFLEAVKQEAEAVGSKFRGTIPAIDALWEFMDANEWFGMECIGVGREIRVLSLEPAKDRLDLWLKAYRKTREEKIDLMLEAYEEKLPETCKLFKRFVDKKVLDFLLATLDGEIIFYNEQRVRILISQANQELSLTGMYQLVDFVNMVFKKKWFYEFSIVKGLKIIIIQFFFTTIKNH